MRLSFLPLQLLLTTARALIQALLLWSWLGSITFALSLTNDLFQKKVRPDVLNLLNHPLQLQLATGDLPLGAFQRLILDRQAILEGLVEALEEEGMHQLLEKELILHEKEANQWLMEAEQAGKTIAAPSTDIKCYNCGGNHLNIDCPDDQYISSSAQALTSLLISNKLVGATAIFQTYGFCCQTLLETCQQLEQQQESVNPVYHGWLQSHAQRWTKLGEFCNTKLKEQSSSMAEDGYTVCLSMLYNWIDAEAANTGIRADLNDPILSTIMKELEQKEPGYAAQRDKHQSFVADITGTKTSEVRQQKAMSKVDKAAAYLAAKNNSTTKNEKLDAAAAYLAAKKKNNEK